MGWWGWGSLPATPRRARWNCHRPARPPGRGPPTGAPQRPPESAARARARSGARLVLLQCPHVQAHRLGLRHVLQLLPRLPLGVGHLRRAGEGGGAEVDRASAAGRRGEECARRRRDRRAARGSPPTSPRAWARCRAPARRVQGRLGRAAWARVCGCSSLQQGRDLRCLGWSRGPRRPATRARGAHHSRLLIQGVEQELALLTEGGLCGDRAAVRASHSLAAPVSPLPRALCWARERAICQAPI
jgi:hypothetical protein